MRAPRSLLGKFPCEQILILSGEGFAIIPLPIHHPVEELESRMANMWLMAELELEPGPLGSVRGTCWVEMS